MKTGKKISIGALMAILAAAGYGGYTLVKEKDLAAMRTGEVPVYTVARVIDGDTFELVDKEVVRLTGIDAPEEGECYYDESKEALRKLVEGKDVELRKDVTNADDFGRLLRYGIVPVAGAKDNILVDEYMVSGGYAEPASNPRDKLYYSLLIEKREEAVKAKRGMWGKCESDVISEHGQASTAPKNAQCTIKGNLAATKTYFTEGCNNYAQVKIDPARGEQYFCSESEAKAAGFMKARYCP